METPIYCNSIRNFFEGGGGEGGGFPAGPIIGQSLAKIQMEQNTIRIRYKENKIQKGKTYRGNRYNLDKIQRD